MFPRNELIADLSGFFKIPEGEAEKKMDEAYKYYAKEWERKPRDTKESRLEFYRTSTFNCFDLARWHCNDKKPQSTYEETCNEGWVCTNGLHKKLKVLDYAAGIGSLCIRLAQQGHEVHYYDVGIITRKFAEYRCKRYNVNVTFHESVNTIPQNYFDMAYCYDTIEHLDDDEMRFALTNIYKALHYDGRLFTSTQFPATQEEAEVKTSHLAEHVGKNQKSIFPMLEEIGYNFVDSNSHFVRGV